MTADKTPSNVSPTPTPSSSGGQPSRKKLFSQNIFHDWCKACGICMAFCPVKIIVPDNNGKPEITDPDKCIGCRFCELHCPDFAITISQRHPRRRKNDV